MSYEGRPAFISAEIFRRPMRLHCLRKYLFVDGIGADAFVAKCERNGRPLRAFVESDGACLYRLLDVVARARTDFLAVQPPKDIALKETVADLQRRKTSLENEVANLESRLGTCLHARDMNIVANNAVGTALLSEREIVAAKQDAADAVGVYFLLRDDRVVYVGQSIEVFSRIAAHKRQKQFDGYAYIACGRQDLSALESLYIHLLRPPLNGRNADGSMLAPISRAELSLRVTGHPAAVSA